MNRTMKTAFAITALILLSASSAPASTIDLLPTICVDLDLRRPVPCPTADVPGPLGIVGVAMAWRTSRQIRRRQRASLSVAATGTEPERDA